MYIDDWVCVDEMSIQNSSQRMMRQRKATNKELSLFVNGFQKQGLDEQSLLEQKPLWMKDSVSHLIRSLSL